MSEEQPEHVETQEHKELDEDEKFKPESVPEKVQMFSDISPENTFTEMESLCMNCHEQGVTRILLTRIPFFKEIVLMAFSCPHCGWQNNEVQSAGTIAEKGCKIQLTVTSKKDMNRNVVKAETATITVPELDFEIPRSAQKGSLNTIEGFFIQAADALKSGQEERRNANYDPEVLDKLDAFIAKLEDVAAGNFLPFTFIVDDPAGNSFIENPHSPSVDPNMQTTHYTRTPEQNWSIGLTTDTTAEEMALKQYEEEREKEKEEGKEKPASGNNSTNQSFKYEQLDFDKFDYKGQVMAFSGNCPSCHSPVDTRMVAVEIPYFKEVIIMSVNCEYCGYKSSDCKAGGPIAPKGKRITLKVSDPEDLNRDILKSETAIVEIPEYDINVSRGSLGGRFTTVEGLLVGIKEDVLRSDPFIRGDSSTDDRKQKFEKLIETLDRLTEGKEPFTVVMTDPVANSYIQNLFAPDPDPKLTIEEYERSWDENEDLGLNDMKTENYEEHQNENQNENHTEEKKE